MTAGVLAALLLAAALAAGCFRTSGPPSTGEAPDAASTVTAPSAASMVTAELAQAWPGGDASFSTAAPTPVALYRDDRSVLYVLENRLLHAAYGQPPSEVYRWVNPRPARAWTAGPAVLIGTGPPTASGAAGGGDTDEKPAPRWLLVTVDPSLARAPRVSEFSPFFGPDAVLVVRVVDAPPLFAVTVENGPSFSEYVYDAASGELRPVADELPPGRSREDHWAEIPERREGAMPFARTRTFTWEDVVVHALEDDRGTILYHERPALYTHRFVDQSVVDLKHLPDIDGGAQFLVQLFLPDGNPLMVFMRPRFGPLALPVEARLWAGEWMALDEGSRALYRLETDRIELVRFEYGGDLGETRFRTYSLGGAQYEGRTDALLAYRVGGRLRHLSLYDLLNVEPVAGRAPPLDELWLHPLPPGRTDRGTRAFPWIEEWKTVDLPEWESLLPGGPRPEPDEVRLAFFRGRELGDYGPDIHYRRIDGVWYVLADTRLYRYDGRDVVELGHLPVTMAREVGEGVNGYTAQDFTRLGGFWYVADTFADRVVKLDDRFEVVAEARAPTPSHIERTADGRLRARTLEGWLTLDSNLRRVAVEPSEFAASRGSVRRDMLPSYHYEDPDAGLVWTYQGRHLVQYRPATGEGRVMFVGALHNARAGVRFLPYRGQVLMLFDNRVHLFARDGQWRRTIAFPRIRPDGIYTTTPLGENSFHLDEPAGKLYLVQGYRVLEIDLEAGAGRTLFVQADWNLGNLVHHGGKLYLSAQVEVLRYYGHYSHEIPNIYTEILVFDLARGWLSRFLAGVEGLYFTVGLDEAGLVLWRYDEPRYMHEAGTYLRYPLDVLVAGEGR